MPIKIRATRQAISDKISKLRHEGMAQQQAIAVALSMAGKSKRSNKKLTPGLRSSYS